MNYSNIRKSIFAILLLHCMPSVLAMQQIAVAQKNGTVFINKAPDRFIFRISLVRSLYARLFQKGWAI